MSDHRVPKRFVGIHAHSGASGFDGLGPASDHFKFCVENGLDAHAMTEHGHMNSFAMAYLFNEKWKRDGVKFKFIPGVEAYVHPDLDQWRSDKLAAEIAAADKKAAKKLKDKQREEVVTEIERITDADDETVEMTNALTIENEEETKGGKTFNPVNRRHHLVILPKTPRALAKVFRLVSKGYLEGFYRFPRIDVKMLKEASAGEGDILISSACLGGILSYAVFERLRHVKFDHLSAEVLDDPVVMEDVMKNVANTFDLYADAVGRSNVMLELQFNRLPAQDLVNRALIEFARRSSLTDQLIVTADSHYARPELWYEREMYKKLGYLNYSNYGPDSLPKSKESLKAELYPKNAQQVWDEYQLAKQRHSFYDGVHDDLVCDAVERAYDVAHNVIGDITFNTSYKFPQKLVPEGDTPIHRLIPMCKEGLIKRGFADRPEYVARLKHELEVIKQMGYAEYFITLTRVMELARSVCLVGPARGSGGGSLAAYVLNITDLDPIKYECRFDRFLNVHREGAPDIDIDVADRDLVLDVLRKEFGYNNVIPISNYNTFKVKTLVKDISKFNDISFDEVNVATKTVEQEVRKATTKHGDDKNLFVLKFDEAMQYSPSFKKFIDKYPHVGEKINILFKEQRSLGRHAGGVVILDDAPGMMPLITSGGEPQTPWAEGVEVKTLEPLGFVKYDLLGLETMRLIQRTIELILQRREGVPVPTYEQVQRWYNEHLHPDSNNYDDQRVYEYVYHKGNFAGIFQCTSRGAQRLFRHAKPTSIVDIATLTSIYRPGPLAANVDKIYLEAKNGTLYDWGHPIFEKVLGQTYNCVIFQESVMDLAEHVGGFPKDQCDKVRKAIMKRSISGGEEAKKKVKEMEDKFVHGAMDLHGMPESMARKAYERIAWMSGYGFNRAHAIAYAIDSYMCAWLLTHYEQEWLCAYMESMSNNPDDKAMAFGEIRTMGYEIVPIDVNHATVGWTILPGKKFMPSLLSCKDVGASAAEELRTMRPFSSIEDMLWNEDGSWRPSKFTKKALEALIKVNAFGSLKCIGEGGVFKNSNHMYQVLVEHGDEIKKSPKKDPQQGKKRFYELVRETVDTPPWTRLEKIEQIVKYFGSLDVTQIISGEIVKKLLEKNVRPIDEFDGQDIYWFCAAKGVSKRSKNGRDYLIMEAVGQSGKVHKIFVWSWDGSVKLSSYALCVAELSKNEFGLSTTQKKLRILEV